MNSASISSHPSSPALPITRRRILHHVERKTRTTAIPVEMPPRPQPTSRRDTTASQPQTLADRRAHAGQSYHIPGLRGSRAPLPATAIRLAREVTAGFGYLYVPREPVCRAVHQELEARRRSRRAWSAAEMAPSVMASSATTVAPFQGLKSTAGMPVARRSGNSSFGNVSNGGRIRCMQIWPIEGIKKFETLSYLPPLTVEDLLKQIEYLLRSKWVPCLEFSKVGFVYRENHRSPGYYDGRYWTMWKLPMFGCSDATQVLKELEEAKKAYPDAFVRIIGFDNVRQVQCISFIAYKPPGCEESGGN